MAELRSLREPVTSDATAERLRAREMQVRVPHARAGDLHVGCAVQEPAVVACLRPVLPHARREVHRLPLLAAGGEALVDRLAPRAEVRDAERALWLRNRRRDFLELNEIDAVRILPVAVRERQHVALCKRRAVYRKMHFVEREARNLVSARLVRRTVTDEVLPHPVGGERNSLGDLPVLAHLALLPVHAQLERAAEDFLAAVLRSLVLRIALLPSVLPIGHCEAQRDAVDSALAHLPLQLRAARPKFDVLHVRRLRGDIGLNQARPLE